MYGALPDKWNHQCDQHIDFPRLPRPLLQITSTQTELPGMSIPQTTVAHTSWKSCARTRNR